MHFHTVAALAASISVVSAIRGFDTGNLFLDQTPKQQSDFTAEFQNQKKLPGTNGAFTAARLYTMIQGGTTDSPISAIPAAIATHTQLLLGLWASAGQSNFDLELNALKSAIQQYGSSFADLVTGISVGSEDLYRVSPIGIKNEPGGVGAGPEEIANYIGQVRNIIKGTALSAAPVGHVDTWTSYVNATNKPAIDACDFIGMNGFPYFQTQNENPIENGGQLLYKAISDTQKGVGNKPIWVTETGWPTSGPKSGQAVASVANARSYWKQVYCTMPASTNLFWFEQTADNNGDTADFGITGTTLSATPEYDLSCDDVVSSSASATASHAATAAHAASSATATAGSSSGSGVVGGSSSGNGSGSEGGKQSGSNSGSGSSEEGSATQSASSSASTNSGSSDSGSSGSGSGNSSGSGSSGSGSGAVYPTASGMATVAVAATGSGGLPAPTSTLSPYQPNSASGLRSTLALLAVPALLALML